MIDEELALKFENLVEKLISQQLVTEDQLKNMSREEVLSDFNLCKVIEDEFNNEPLFKWFVSDCLLKHTRLRR